MHHMKLELDEGAVSRIACPNLAHLAFQQGTIVCRRFQNARREHISFAAETRSKRRQ
jgi:hypothetical protein